MPFVWSYPSWFVALRGGYGCWFAAGSNMTLASDETLWIAVPRRHLFGQQAIKRHGLGQRELPRGPRIEFEVVFPRSRAYRLWVQFQKDGIVNTVHFDVPVEALPEH
jgi:hypothetical protein